MLLNLMRFDHQLLVLGNDFGLHLGNDLVGDVIDMSSSFDGTNRIGERDLLELAIAEGCDDLPSLILRLDNFGKLFVFLILQVEVAVLGEVLHFYSLAIQKDLDFLIGHSGQVKSPLAEQAYGVLVHAINLEFFQIWEESHASEVILRFVLLDQWLFCHCHVVFEHLTVQLASL